jgi:hypothetical protein
MMAQSAFFETQDMGGWVGTGSNNFIEGIRAHARLNAGTLLGSAYGAIAAGIEESTATHTYLIGLEAEVDSNSVDSGVVLNPNNFAAPFVATSRGANKVDAGYVVNPYTNTVSQFNVGFLVPAGAGTAATPVVNAAFQSDAPAVFGLHITNATPPTFAAIGIPNNSPIRATNAANNAELEIIRLNTSNNLTLGAQASAVIVGNTVAVGSLPAAASSGGARAMVNNSNVVASGNFGAIVAGGGANTVPVYSDGTNWRIG